MVTQQITVDARDLTKVLTNFRVWVPQAANEINLEGAKTVRRYAKQNIRSKSGMLKESMVIITSPKSYSATLMVDAYRPASNKFGGKGHYAKAVEDGGFNPRTGRNNRAQKYMQRAINRYAGEQKAQAEMIVNNVFKKK